MNEQEFQWHEKAFLHRLNDPAVSITDLANLAEHNPELTERILSKANSALYGSRRPVTTLKQAILLIGFRNVKNIVQEMHKEKKAPAESKAVKKMEL
ncbi:MAG: HDOD domain-containing protein [Planctomycetota bacterium]